MKSITEGTTVSIFKKKNTHLSTGVQFKIRDFSSCGRICLPPASIVFKVLIRLATNKILSPVHNQGRRGLKNACHSGGPEAGI